MALLKLESKKEITDLNEIRNYLKPLNIELSHWPIEKTEKIGALLKADALNDSEKETLLQALDSRFEEQKKQYGYQTRDLVVLHSKVPNLEQMLSIFDKTHRHSDDEVRYIVDGSGIFGFIMPDGEQVMLTVEAEEYIRVPTNTEHWFVLDNFRRIKAVRYFTSKEGWVANYSGTPVRVGLTKNQEFREKAQDIANIGRFFAEHKWSPATSSNYSARLETLPGLYALTRSGVDKYAMTAADVILVDGNGKVVEPAGERPSAETLIHCYLYKNPEVGAVLHTHSVFGTRLSLKHLKREKLEISDYELLKGLAGNNTHEMTEIVPILPNAQDMNAFVKTMEPLFTSGQKLGLPGQLRFHGFLIAGHGLYTWGKDLKEARRHVETYEFLFEAMAYAEMGF